VKAPKRRFVLTIEIGADTWTDALRDLKDIVRGLEGHDDDPRLFGSCMGSPSVGHVVEVHEDPTMTHERYVSELETYLSKVGT
jgi:hypothetical protein